MLTQEQRIKNLGLWSKKLNDIGINTDKLIELYGNKIQNAPLADNSVFGMAYEGALIYQNLYKLTPYALHINEKLSDTLKVDKNNLIKACLLSNLAKAVMLKPETEKWKNDRGIYWSWNNNDFAFRGGQRTLLMLQECDVYDNLSLDIVESILSSDVLPDDTFFTTNASTLSTVIRLANQLMWHEQIALIKLHNKEEHDAEQN